MAVLSTAYRSIVIALVTALPAAAQSIPGAVLAQHEPHHHLAYEDSAIRVLRVRVPAHDTTLLHEHDPDYFWIALGASEVVNAKLGAPDATIKSADLTIHYSFGHFAHVARNPGAAPFDNITVELLGEQTSVRNLCEEAVAGAPTSCPSTASTPQPGITVHRAFETDQLRVDLVTLAAGAELSGVATGAPPWIIALSARDAAGTLRIGVPADRGSPPAAHGPDWRDGVWRAAPQRNWSVRNTGAAPVRVLEVTPVTR